MVKTNYNYTKNNLDFQGFDDSLPPQSVELEEQILGGILLDSNAIERVKDILPSEAFYLEANQIIYRACLALYDQGKACDLMTVEAYLKEKRKYSKVGEKPKLVILASRTVSAVNIDFYAETVVRKWYQRQLIELSRHTERACFSNPTSVDQLIENLREDIEKLADSPFLKRDDDPQFAEYQKMLQRVKEIELNSDPGFREWLMQNLATEYKRSARQLEDVYFKNLAATEVEPSMTFEELKEKYGDDCTEWFLHGLLPKGAVVLLHALGYTGKTRLFYDLLFSLVTGQPWADFQPTAPQRRVLIIQADETPSDMLRAIQQRGLDDPSYPVRYKTKWLADHMDDLRREIEQWQPDLVMIDSLTAINRRSTFEENQTEYARPVFMLRDIAQEFGISILLTHHSNSEGKARGTKAVFNAVSEVWALSRLENDKRLDSPVRQLKLEKTRSRCPETYKIQYDPDTAKWIFEGVMNFEGVAEDLMNEAERKIFEFLTENKGIGFERIELCESLGYSDGHLRKTIKPLLHRGLITQRRSKTSRRYVYLVDWEGDQSDHKVIISDDHLLKQPENAQTTTNSEPETITSSNGDHKVIICDDHFETPEKVGVSGDNLKGDHQNCSEINKSDHPKNDDQMITFAETPTVSEEKGDHPEMITHDHLDQVEENRGKTANKKEEFKVGDQVEFNEKAPFKGTAFVTGVLKGNQYEVCFDETKDLTTIHSHMINLKARKKIPAYQGDLPLYVVERLVIAYLQEHGETEEYELICYLKQKSPAVRSALQRVAIQTQRIHKGGYYETYWKLKEDSNE